MSIRIITGYSGSGKTAICLNEIADKCRKDPFGPPIFIIVPEQASYETERALLSVPGFNGYTRAQVLSFTRLGEFLFAHEPAGELPAVTSSHRPLIALYLKWKLQKEEDLDLLQMTGIDETLDAFLRECAQYGLDHDRFEEMLAYTESSTEFSSLQDKLSQLKKVFDASRELIKERFEDPSDTMKRLTRQIETSDLLTGAEIYIDSFVDFTPPEEQLVTTLAGKCQKLSLLLTMRPIGSKQEFEKSRSLARHVVFQTCEETLENIYDQLLKEGTKIDEWLPCDNQNLPRFNSADLAHLAQNFYSFPDGEPQKVNAIEREVVETKRDEARRAAEVALNWIYTKKWNPSDVAILVRSIDTYANSLSESLGSLSLPYFIDRSEPLTIHPLLVGIQCLVRLLTHPDDIDALIRLGKSGFLDLERSHLDYLQRIQLEFPRTSEEWYGSKKWRIRQNRNFFEDDDGSVLDTQDEELPEKVEETRQKLAAVASEFQRNTREKFSPQSLFHDFLNQIYIFLEQTLDYGALNEKDQNVLEQVGKVLCDLDDILGNEYLTIEPSCELLLKGLSQLAEPRIPPLLNQIFVGQMDRSRLPPVKGVILLGLNEGETPALATNRTVLNDAEREYLRAAGFKFSNSSQRRYDREIYIAYKAFTAASEALHLMRHRTDENGGVRNPSLFWSDLDRKFKLPPPKELPAYRPLESCWRPREVASNLLHGLRQEKDAKAARDSDGRFLLNPAFGNEAVREMETVIDAYMWKNKASLSPQILRDFYSDGLSVSTTELETRANCPFKHFVSFMLRPSYVDEIEFNRKDAGNFAHACLKNFTELIREALKEGRLLDALPVEDLIDDALEGPQKKIERFGIVRRPSGRYLLNRLTEQVKDCMRWLVLFYTEYAFQPIGEELSFGKGRNKALPPLKLPGNLKNGLSVHIRGQIDRLDQDGDEALIVDYKLREKKFDFDKWISEENLQLPIYILTIMESKSDLTPVGGMYVPILEDRKTKVSTPLGKTRSMKGLAKVSYFKNRGLTKFKQMDFIQGSNGDPEEKNRSWGSLIKDDHFEYILRKTWKQIRNLAEGIVSGNIAVQPTRHGTDSACSFCDHRSICGIDPMLNYYRDFPKYSREGILNEIDASLNDPEGNGKDKA